MKKLTAIILALMLMLTFVNMTAFAVSDVNVSFKVENISRTSNSVYKGDVFKLSVILDGITTYGGFTAAIDFDNAVVAPCLADGTVKTAWEDGILASTNNSKLMQVSPTLVAGKVNYTHGMNFMVTSDTSIPVTSPYTAFSLYFKAVELGDMKIVYNTTDSTFLLESIGDVVPVTVTPNTLTVEDLPQAPVAKNVTIPAVIRDADEVTATYTFEDANGDLEGTSTYKWYLDGTVIDGKTTKTISIIPAYVGKNLEFEVLPKSVRVDDPAAVAVKSSAVKVLAKADYKPTFKSIAIEGTAKVGREMTVVYVVDDKYTVESEASTFAWYIKENAEEADGTAVSTTKAYTAVKEDAEKFAFVKGTPIVTIAGEIFTGDVAPVVVSEKIAKATKNSPGPIGPGATLPPINGTTPPATTPPVTTPPVQTGNPNGIKAFTDVSATNYSWAASAIDTLVKEGIIKGITEKTFEPETKTTKAQLVAMTIRALGLVDETATTTLVDAKYWGYKEIASAKKLGVIDFFGDKFDADSVITREEMATVIAKAGLAAKVTFPTTAAAENFKDASSISSFATDAVKALQQAGIINGMGDGTFAPKGQTTRAQAAKVIAAVKALKK